MEEHPWFFHRFIVLTGEHPLLSFFTLNYSKVSKVKNVDNGT
jgi:hypothetical protein